MYETDTLRIVVFLFGSFSSQGRTKNTDCILSHVTSALAPDALNTDSVWALCCRVSCTVFNYIIQFKFLVVWSVL